MGHLPACVGGRAGVEQGRRKTNQRLLTPILDPSLPADHSPLVSGELRGQFQAIQNNFYDIRVAAFYLAFVAEHGLKFGRDLVHHFRRCFTDELPVASPPVQRADMIGQHNTLDG